MDYQSKSITPVDDYVFTLSNELATIAENELRETEEVRNNAIKVMRDWTMNNPRILKTRLDSNFLLRFLRFRKFSIPMAQEALERYLVLKQGSFGKDWFNILDVTIPSVEKLLDSGYIFPLIERDHGRRIIFSRPGIVDLTCSTAGNDCLMLLLLAGEALLDDEESQIRGIVHMIDHTGVSLSHFKMYSPQFAMRLGKNAEKFTAMRHKGFHSLNLSPSLKWISDLFLSHMSEKLQSRVHLCSNIDDLKLIDRTILPFEYGGTIPIKDMVSVWKKELQSLHNLRLKYKDMKVRAEMYPPQVLEGSIKTLKYLLNSPDLNEKNTNDSMHGIQGSFRKLEID